jgi:hypothetical protein
VQGTVSDIAAVMGKIKQLLEIETLRSFLPLMIYSTRSDNVLGS